MNDDDRLTQYLSDRADSIALAPGDMSDITVRVTRRRRSRRTFGAAAAVAVLAVGAVVFLSRSPSHQSVRVAGDPEPSRAPLTWSSVDVPEGLGWSLETVTTGGGSLFSLSTAPGVFPPGSNTQVPQVVYRSTEGRAWSTITLPDTFSPTALASSPGHLYAVGTMPGGGNTFDFAVASSTDDGTTWSDTRLPQPEAALKAQYPSEVQISTPVIASGPQGVVAAITVSAMPNIQALLPSETMNSSWNTTPTGVDIYAPCSPDAQSSGAAPSTVSTPPTPPYCSEERPPIQKSYTWDELGVDPALRPLIGGRVHLYASQDGISFSEVASPPIGGGYVASLIASGDGYRMLTSGQFVPGLQPYYSPDGTNWTKTADSGFDGWVVASGLIDGEPVAFLESLNGLELLTASRGGGWLHPVGINDALGLPLPSNDPNRPGIVGLQAAVVGPLGVAAVYSTGDQTFVAESADGRHFTTRPLSDITDGGPWNTVGISMSADAVVVRLLPAPAPGTDPANAPVPGPQRLLVGTIT